MPSIFSLPAQTVLNDVDTLVYGKDPAGTPLASEITALNARKYFSPFVNVKDYGAKGDGVTVVDGAMTSSSATLTSATAGFTAADVGKPISVAGAGASAAILSTTIAGFTNSTTVTLTATASTTVSAAKVRYGTSDTSAILAAMTAAAAAGGGDVYLPPGSYLLGTTLSLAGAYTNVRLRGAGQRATTLFCTSALTQMILIYNGTTGAPTYNLALSDMMIDGSLLSGTPVATAGNACRDLMIERCTVRDATSNMLTADTVNGLTVQDCYFYGSNGRGVSGISMLGGGERARIRRCRMEFLTRHIDYSSDNIPFFNPEVTDCYVDGHWWQLPYDTVSSGGTVTYTATSVTDTAAPWGAIASGYTTLTRAARVLNPLVTSNGSGVTYSGSKIMDATSTLTSLKFGHIIRTADRWCIVHKVYTTTIYTGQWYKLGADWGEPTTAPANGTAYTVYEPLMGRVISMTSTTLNINVGWYRFGTGALVTPSAGAIVELLIYNQSMGVHFAPGVHGGLVARNTLMATWFETCFMWGNGLRVLDNYIRDSQDHAITLDGAAADSPAGNSVVSGNRVINPGAAGVAILCDRNLVEGNTIEGPMTASYVSSAGGSQAAIYIIGGSNNLITSNRFINDPNSGWAQASALAVVGLYFGSGSAGNDCRGNFQSGFSSGIATVDPAAGTGNLYGDIVNAVVAGRAGTLIAETALTTKTTRWYNRTGKTINFTTFHAAVDGAPTGSAITVGVRKNAAGSNSSTISISAAANTGSNTPASVVVVNDGDYLQAWPTAVGSTVAGSDLAVTAVGMFAS